MKPRANWECITCFCLKDLEVDFLGSEKGEQELNCYSHKDSSHSFLGRAPGRRGSEGGRERGRRVRTTPRSRSLPAARISRFLPSPIPVLNNAASSPGEGVWHRSGCPGVGAHRHPSERKLVSRVSHVSST